MTDRALDDLIAAVEAGALPEAIFHGCSVVSGHWAYKTGLTAEQRNSVFLAYNGSLDAAKALHEALLSKDCHFNLMEDEDAGGYQAEVYLNRWIYAGLSCPARAWLLAILRAYRGMQG
ncbi:hypothetical protein [Gemmobacter sp. 24YEA27]|uniref:hypothetical protein n=1 Tax=Gemmobacter sp. 24YEA27 TaxID=3040672 RepID=UPI0024B37DF9|nr:hypothetical protein [Gemmobacter sp. 24YEA27]